MSIKNSLVIILIFLVSIIAGFFGYLIYQEKTDLSPVISEKNVNKNYPEDLKGKVYLTLINNKTKRPGIYSFDLNKNQLETIHLIKDKCYLLGGEINKNNDRMLIANSCEVENFASVQIYMADRNKSTKVITKSLNNLKQEPIWSTNQTQIAFKAISTGSEEKNWQLFTSDLEGNEKLVATDAFYPTFSPDDRKILALKKEGIFLFNLEMGTEEKVHAFETEVPKNSYLTVSLKKDLLAFSNPIKKEVTIFKINSWSSFEIKEIAKVKTSNSYLAWPKFDPNGGDYLIAQEIFEDNKIELVAYNFKTNQRYSLVNLANYFKDFFWINDWR